MNWLIKYRNNKKLSVIAGVLLAITIVTTQSVVYYFQPGDSVTTHTISDQDHDNNEPAPQYLSQDAVSVSTVHINLDKPYQLVCELIQSEDSDTQISPGSVPLNFEFFKILFRLTISPNAP